MDYHLIYHGIAPVFPLQWQGLNLTQSEMGQSDPIRDEIQKIYNALL